MVEPLMRLRRIGVVESPLEDPDAMPKQGDEGAPDAWLVVDEDLRDALDGLAPGDRIIVLTWLHLAPRDVLTVHPRGDPGNPERGVFSTRSPARPNPIGMHPTEILAIDGLRLRVRSLDAIDGTPVIDIKPVRASEAWGR